MLTKAYQKLGVKINSGEARSAWSAVCEEHHIVAITIWMDEIRRDPETGIYFLDTRTLEEAERGPWRDKRGNLQRLKHLHLAMDWGGLVRIVKVFPQPGRTPEDRHVQMTAAHPWLYEGRPIEARLVFFDGVDFRVEVDPTRFKHA